MLDTVNKTEGSLSSQNSQSGGKDKYEQGIIIAATKKKYKSATRAYNREQGAVKGRGRTGTYRARKLETRRINTC